MNEEYRDSTALLDEPAALRARLNQDGYVFLRGVAPQNALLQARRQMRAMLAEAGWIRSDRPLADMIAVPERACAEPQDAYVTMMYRHSALKVLHALQHRPDVVALFECISGEPVFQHPRFNTRYSFPGYDLGQTLAHQDYPHVQGSQDSYTIWMPMDDLTPECSVLELAVGSHRDGVFDYRPAHGAGQMEAVVEKEYSWVSGKVSFGDAIVFHCHTLHRATANRSDRLRLSIDYRFQPASHPVCERVLIPSNQRTAWEALYAGWDDDEYKYYWRERDLRVVPFDYQYHDRRDIQAVRMGEAGEQVAYNTLEGIATGHREPAMRTRAKAALAFLDALAR